MKHAFLTSYNSLFFFSAKQGLLIFSLFLIWFNDVYATYHETYRNGQCVEKDIEKKMLKYYVITQLEEKIKFPTNMNQFVPGVNLVQNTAYTDKCAIKQHQILSKDIQTHNTM
jgi:hypothetical protein